VRSKLTSAIPLWGDMYDIRFSSPFHLITLSAGLPTHICTVQILGPAADSADPSCRRAALLPTNDNVLGSISRMHEECRDGVEAGPIPLICTHRTIFTRHYTDSGLETRAV
jgi:hypothetical protein